MPAKKTTKTKYSYTKSTRTPSERKEPRGWVPPMNKPKARTELLEHIEKAREEFPGVSTLDLLRAFQGDEEADAEIRAFGTCKHDRVRVVIAVGPHNKLTRCPSCGHVKIERK